MQTMTDTTQQIENLSLSQGDEQIEICESILNIDPIFTKDDELVESVISEQFQMMGAPLTKRYCTKLMEQDMLANLFKTISGNIINIGLIVKSEQIKEVVQQVVDPKKKPTKADIIRSNLDKAKKELELETYFNYMKTHEKELLECDNPTIPLISGILEIYKTPISNKIMKLVILRSLIAKYKKTGDELFVSYIFEFMMELNFMKNEWHIEEQAGVVAEVVAGVAAAAAAEPVVRKGGRAARHQALRQAGPISNFNLQELDDDNKTPLIVKELNMSKFSERLKLAIKCSVIEAHNILESKGIDPIKYQMVETYYRLRPVSSWDKKVLSLDDWQRTIIKYIDQKESVVITAPTSCGKTVCAQYCAYNENVKKVLFVVPCSVLANQVAGAFSNSGFRTALITNEEDYNLSDDCKIIVATPNRAEEVLCSMSIKLDYAVFDEIQQINEFEGESIERLIKMCNCPFLILSATIYEPEKFVEFLKETTHKDVKLVSYNKRFIVQQKHLWNGTELITMHPLSCVDKEYIIEDQFKTGDLAMTSRDLHEMGVKMSLFFPSEQATWKLHPDLYFSKDVPITMDMVSEYEKHLKDSLVRLTFLKPDDVCKFLESISASTSSIWTVEEKELIPSVVKLFKNLKAKQMLPALVFMLNDIAVLNVYKQVVNYLEYIESYYFPWYNSLWENLASDIQLFKDGEEKLKTSIANGIKGKGNPVKQIQDKCNQAKCEYIKSFLEKIKHKYMSEKTRFLENDKYNEDEKQMVSSFLENDYKHKYNTYYKNQLNSQEIVLPEFNQYCPTSLFSFHKNALSINTMRYIVKNLRKFLSQSVDKSVAKEMNYENIFIRGLERGIILYSKILPTPFQRVVQELITNHQAPICICDDSLAYGVNYPARTVVILGNEASGETISVLKAQQISGRSGRRGFDVQGHVVYCRVNYKNIMRGTYAPLIGKDIITQYTLLPAKIFSELDSVKFISNIIEKPLNVYVSGNDWNKQDILDGLKQLYEESDTFKQNSLMMLLLWYFRDEVLIAPNLYILINVLLSYKDCVSIDITKKHIEKPNHKSLVDKHDDGDEDYTIIDGFKVTTKYKISDVLKFQIIEILFKVLDQEDEPNEDVENQFVSSDKKFQDIVNSQAWNVPLNNKSNDIIYSVIKNNIDTDEFGHIAKIVNKVHKVVLYTLKIYNMFTEIGNQKMVGVLDQALTYLINFNNKLKSLN